MKKSLLYFNKIHFYLFLLTSIVALNYRPILIDAIYGEYTRCIGCFQLWVLNSDAWIFIVTTSMLILSFIMRSYLVRLFFRSFIVITLTYYLIDLYVYKSINQRLYLSDIRAYFDIEAIKEIINQNLGAGSIYLSILIGMPVLTFIFFHSSITFNKFEKSVLFFIFIILTTLTLLPTNTDYAHNSSIRNVAALNFNSGESIDYSATTNKNAAFKIKDIENLSCNNNGLNQKKNIILLVVESLPLNQSKLYSGIENWTPKLDEIALKHHYFTNFFANNFTSMDGRHALLTGEKTFREIKAFEPKDRIGYWNSQRNIPLLLKDHGYHTSFLDGANLHFTKTGEFMRAIGFDYVEGQEYAGYKGMPRYGFNSVSDEVLYNRALNFIGTVKKPFFTTIITVTTHPPFVDPKTHELSLEKATKFADNAAYDFYKELIAQGFFDNGILIITSDHRSMTPVMKDEMALYGKQAVARIPLIIVDESYTGKAVSHEYLQQSDLLNSLEYFISDTHCSRKGEGNIFSTPPKPAKCIYHNRGDYRDRIDVYCSNGRQSATIELNGDNTYLIDGNLTGETEVLEMINNSRIGARIRHQRFLNNTLNQTK